MRDSLEHLETYYISVTIIINSDLVFLILLPRVYKSLSR